MKENTLLTKRKSKIQEKKDQENKISTMLSTQSTKKQNKFWDLIFFSFINCHLWGLRFSLLSLFETTEKTKTYADKEGQAMYSRSA